MKQLPAETYYIGDPCYVIDPKDWMYFLEEFWRNGDEGIFEFKGATCFVSNTAYGDGGYLDQYGHNYSVDSGLIGAIPITLICKDNDADLGWIHTFSKPFSVSKVDRSDEGKIVIGRFEILTAPDGDEEDYYYDN